MSRVRVRGYNNLGKWTWKVRHYPGGWLLYWIWHKFILRYWIDGKNIG